MRESTNQPLLSVIVPVYNGQDYIESTIASILCSEYESIELLLIDDGSTDESSRICADYAKKDARIRYVRTENGGIVAARNTGLKLAQGEYVCFGDQDDVVEASAYADMMARVLQEKAQIVICSTGRLIDGQKSIYESLQEGCYRQDEVLTYLLYPILFRGYDYPFVKPNNYLYGTLWKCIFKKSFLSEHHLSFRRFVNYEDDWLFVTEALSFAEVVVTTSKIGYYWRVNDASKSHEKHYIADLQDRFKALDNYVSDYLRARIKDAEIFEAYCRINCCDHYVEMYKNALGAVEKADKQASRRMIREYLAASNYKEQVTCVRGLSGAAFRRRMILGSLKHFGIGFTFMVNKWVSWAESFVGRIQWIVLLERKCKLKKQREAGR